MYKEHRKAMAGTGAQIPPWCAAPRLVTGARGQS